MQLDSLLCRPSVCVRNSLRCLLWVLRALVCLASAEPCVCIGSFSDSVPTGTASKAESGQHTGRSPTRFRRLLSLANSGLDWPGGTLSSIQTSCCPQDEGSSDKHLLPSPSAHDGRRHAYFLPTPLVVTESKVEYEHPLLCLPFLLALRL